MMYLLHAHHLRDLLVGIGGPVLLLALVGWHQATKTQRPDRRAAAVLPRLEPLRTAADVAEAADKTAWLARVRALEDGRLRKLEEATIAISRDDITLLFRRQDREIGEAYVRDLEARLAAEQAPAFGFVYLMEGASR